MRKIKNFIHLLEAYYWVWRCGAPGRKLYVIGVTGTDGKTTTCTLIYEILKTAGMKTGLITTVNAKIGSEEVDTGLHTTNPHPSLLQPLLAKMVKKGMTHCVLEVTSHGLDQNRVAGIDFQIGVLTNITHEHLDYHHNMQNYIDTKLKLFKNTKYAVLNRDDKNFAYCESQIINNNEQTIIKYTKSKLQNISESLAGDYNRYNVAAAVEVAKILGIKKRLSDKVIKRFGGVAGRRQEVKNNKGFKVYVDFAHTPNGLEQILTQLRKEGKEKLIVVFGCTGERDEEKRPMMGEIATRIADIVIITSDDTRSESQDEIAKQILSGILPSNPPPKLGGGTKGGSIFVINDRYKAINEAIGMARKGDIVLLAGKGHEKSILIGKTEQPWSDVVEAGKILRYEKN